MNKLYIKTVFIIALLLITFLVAYNYVYKSHRIIENEPPAFIISSSDLIYKFNSNLEISTNKYLDKTIQVEGIVTALDNSILVIESAITCYLIEAIETSQLLNKRITIKGRCLGFDELLEEIKIDQCVIITN